MRTVALLATAGALAVGGSGCARVIPEAAATAAPATPETVWLEEGVASWYGEALHGRQTASGDIYDMEALTAAHRTLPFGTLLRVQNLDNGRTTTVRINDRGPFVAGRELDVSRRAAQDLGMIRSGIARVRLTIVEP